MNQSINQFVHFILGHIVLKPRFLRNNVMFVIYNTQKYVLPRTFCDCSNLYCPVDDNRLLYAS